MNSEPLSPMGSHRLSVAVLLPANRLWKWHRYFLAQLKQAANVAAFLIDAPSYSAVLRAWLRVETLLFGPKGWSQRLAAGQIGGAARLPPDMDLSGYDLILDLSERDQSYPNSLRLLYDGTPDSSSLFGRLLHHEIVYLSVVGHDNFTVADSFPAVNGPALLTDALQFVAPRLATLALRGLERRGKPHLASALPPLRGIRRPRLGDVCRFAVRAFASQALTRVKFHLMRPEHWTIAWRARADNPSPERQFAAAQLDPRVYHADPFLLRHEGESYVFAEAFSYAEGRGHIVWSRLDESGLLPFRTALERPYHLSYPQVFAYGGQIYMLPETAERRRLELYVAEDFPTKWRLDRVLMDGECITDATLFEHEGRWWLLATRAMHHGSSWDELFGWWSEDPRGPWTPHRLQPLKSDVRSARPAGGVIREGLRLIRPAQNCSRRYGAELVWNEILELTPETFREQVISTWTPRQFGPFTGVHTYNADTDFEVIDLRRSIRRRSPWVSQASRAQRLRPGRA